jgi:hypothetical protein
MTWLPTRNSNGIAAIIVRRICAEAAPITTTKAAVAIMNLVVSFFIVIPSFGFAAAFPICRDTMQLACHDAGARKVLKTRSRDADFPHLRPDRFTAVNQWVQRTDLHRWNASPNAPLLAG